MSIARKFGIFVMFLLLVSIVAVAAGAWWWWQRPTTSDMNPLEGWCAAQLRRMADDLIAPTFAFDAIQLELPATVTLTNVSLTSGNDKIITMTSMRLEFNERPQRGKPLVIKAATFVKPDVRLVENDDGKLLGFDGFMKSTTGKTYADGGSSKPSDVFAIRAISITDGMLEWSPTGYEHPMRFNELDMDLTTSPDEARPGWYAFKADIERPPVMKLVWDGGIDIDTGDLAFDDTTLTVDLSEDDYTSLTPSIQDFLRQYAIVGKLTLHVTGQVPLQNAEATDLTIDASIDHSSAAFGEYQFPIDNAELKATFKQMSFAFDPLDLKAFGGETVVSGTVGFTDAEAFSLKVDATDLLIQNMLRAEPGKPPKFAGKVGLDLTVGGQRAEPPAMTGTGKLTIADGNLISIPVVSALANSLNVLGGEGERDKGEIEFTLASDRATLTKSIIQSRLIAARGTGDIHYDGELDLRVNAGVLEKAESLLGGIGDIFGAVTDRLLTYLVKGTWSKPVVTSELLGVHLGGRDADGEK